MRFAGLGPASFRPGKTLKGVPLTAPIITGRRVLEAPDSALAPAELDATAEGITGRIPEAATTRELRGDAGQ